MAPPFTIDDEIEYESKIVETTTKATLNQIKIQYENLIKLYKYVKYFGEYLKKNSDDVPINHLMLSIIIVFLFFIFAIVIVAIGFYTFEIKLEIKQVCHFHSKFFTIF